MPRERELPAGHWSRRLDGQKRYHLAEVAEMLRISPKYLYRCVVSARNEVTRQKYGISIETLRNLPVRDWFQQGAAWVIRERDLIAQLESDGADALSLRTPPMILHEKK